MYRFVPYMRTDEGDVQRVSFAIYKSPDDVVAPYVHEEPPPGLAGAKGFWAAKFGPSVGIAPIRLS